MATAEQEQIGEFLLDEKTLREIEAMKGAGQWSIVWRRIKKDKMGMLGLYIVLFLILMAFASWILLGFDNWLTELGVLYGDPEKIGSINNLYIELWLPGMPKDSPLVLFQHPRHHFAAEARLPPSFLHPFGTDGIGHDMLSRVFFGATVSLALGYENYFQAYPTKLFGTTNYYRNARYSKYYFPLCSISILWIRRSKCRELGR